MVTVADGVCGIFGKTHINRSVSVVYRYGKLPPVSDGGDSVNFRVTAR